MKIVLGGEQQQPSVHTFYAEEAYGRALAAETGQTWKLFSASDSKWRLPVLVNPVEGAAGYDACSPYGYSGIYADSSLSPVELSKHWGKTIGAMGDAGIVSLFLRFPPYKCDGQDVTSFLGLEELHLESVSQTVEVATSTSEHMWSNLAGRARTATRKAIKSGMVAEVMPASRHTLGAGSAFRYLYESTMNRVGAKKQHLYGDAYYYTLLTELDNRVRVVRVSTAEGAPAASAILLLDESVVHYHLSGSDPQGARDGANNLLIWAILEWSAQNGYRAVHLGGGLSSNDNLFRFKESFGGERLDFWVGRAIIDASRYVELTVQRARSTKTTIQQLESTGYFPTYRAVP